MPLTRRSTQRVSGSIWPGFVDAMTALLLVLMFVLTIFMIVQFMLRETISTQDTELEQLTLQITGLADALGLERRRSFDLEERIVTLSDELEDSRSLAAAREETIALLTERNRQNDAAIADFEARVAALLSEAQSAEDRIAALLVENRDQTDRITSLTGENEEQAARIGQLEGAREGLFARVEEIQAANARLIGEKEALNLALARAREEVDAKEEEARLAAARREALELLIADLRVRNAETARTLTSEEEARLVEAAAAERLRSELSKAQDDLAAMSLALDRARENIDAREAEARLALAREEALNEMVAQMRAEAEGTEVRLTAILAQLDERAGEAEAARVELEAAREELDEAERARLAEEAAAAALRNRIGILGAALSEEERARIAEAEAARRLRERLADANEELTATRLSLEQARREAEETLTLLAAARAASDGLDKQLAAALAARADAETALREFRGERESRLAELEAENAALRRTLESGGATLEERLADALAAASRSEAAALSERERQAALLAQAKAELANADERTLEAERKLEALALVTQALRDEVANLKALLDIAAEEDAAAQIQIQSLGTQLNQALARTATEQKRRAEAEEALRRQLEEEAKQLERFRSEFFGRLRDVLDGVEGVRIVGDRFVFSSEVLFGFGSAELSVEGRSEIAKVADLLRAVIDDIPAEIDWIIRVDGHTDDVGAAAANWVLSQQRALSVVLLLSEDLGIPPERLAATGFGEFQPVDPARTSEARDQNRRIEIKLTER